MTGRFKDFGSGVQEEKEPLSFRLHGEDFSCRPAVQGKFMLDVVKDAASDDVVTSTQVVNNFFERVLFPESWERFSALVSDPDKIVSVETLAEITSWLMGEYTSRPEEQPEVSSPGQ